eukprot:Gb_20364 [translate_table: standard]
MKENNPVLFTDRDERDHQMEALICTVGDVFQVAVENWTAELIDRRGLALMPLLSISLLVTSPKFCFPGRRGFHLAPDGAAHSVMHAHMPCPPWACRISHSGTI